MENTSSMESVRVPVMVQGRVHTLPFILFVRWTVQERREMENLLAYMQNVKASGGSIPTELRPAASKLSEFMRANFKDFDDMTQEAAKVWVRMQRNMIHVPEFDFGV